MADIVTLWSKTADFSAAVPDFPGVFEKSLWDSEADATKFYGTNGTYISSDVVGSALTHAGAEFTIAISDTTGILADMYVWIPETPSLNDEGYYRIKSVQANTTITCEDLALDEVGQVVENDTITHYIGGVSDAFDSSTALQEELDLIGPNCGAGSGTSVNNLDILCHASTALILDATIDIDAISGSSDTQVIMRATDSAFVLTSTKLEITTGTSIIALFDFGGGVTHLGFEDFNFNGSNIPQSGHADWGVFSDDDTVGNIYFKMCRFHNCTKNGAATPGTSVTLDTWNFYDCEIDNNGLGGGTDQNTAGITGRVTGRGVINMYGCHVHNNVGSGARFGMPSKFVNNVIEGNGLHGLMLTGNTGAHEITGNTIRGNGGSAIKLFADAFSVYISDNSAFENVGIAYDLAGLTPAAVYFSNNHSKNNLLGVDTDGPTSHCTEAITLALFEVYGLGDNIPGNPDFDADSIPSATSVLNNKGVGGVNYTIGAKSATAGGGAGGLLRHPGMNGGMNG